MNRFLALPAMALAVGALAVACSSSTKNAVSSPPSSGGGSASSAAQILVDGSGHTLYLLTADTGSKSTCYGTCASFWPADHTTGMPST